MIFHVQFDYSPENRDRVHERFKKTGAPPPDGVTMTGRWHDAGGNRGFLVAEASEAGPVARWFQEWTGIMSFEVTPVVTDAEFGEIVD
jgi:hypothetical protein